MIGTMQKLVQVRSLNGFNRTSSKVAEVVEKEEGEDSSPSPLISRTFFPSIFYLRIHACLRTSYSLPLTPYS